MGLPATTPGRPDRMRQLPRLVRRHRHTHRRGQGLALPALSRIRRLVRRPIAKREPASTLGSARIHQMRIFLPVLTRRTPPGLPAFRGLLHAWAFSLAIPAGVVLGVMAGGGRAHVAAAIFGGTVVTMFGASALYHRFVWSPQARVWLRRLDHFGIFGLIAGSYTAVGLLVLSGTSRLVVLICVWSGVAVTIAM